MPLHLRLVVRIDCLNAAVFFHALRVTPRCVGMLSGVDRDDQIDRSCTRFLLITYSRLRNTTSFGIHLEFTHG